MTFGKVATRIRRTGDRNTDDAQRDANATREALNQSGVARGRFAFDTDAKVKDISFTSGTAKRVLHGLGLPRNATPGGIIPVYTSAACSFYVTAWDQYSVTVMPSATCTGRLWVFP